VVPRCPAIWREDLVGKYAWTYLRNKSRTGRVGLMLLGRQTSGGLWFKTSLSYLKNTQHKKGLMEWLKW
jgi:hypothetical protein